MADILLDEQSAPSTPTSGQGTVFIDTAGVLCYRGDDGRIRGSSDNAAIAAVTGFAADTYVVDSDLLIPSFGLQARTKLQWRISASKSGAGIATPIYVVRIGSARTVAGDTARLTLTGPAQTAIADIGTLNVIVTVRSIGAAGVLQGTAWWDHRGTAASTTVSGTGFANDTTGHVEGTSAGIDMTALAGQYVGLSINGGTSAAWTTTQVWADATW